MTLFLLYDIIAAFCKHTIPKGRTKVEKKKAAGCRKKEREMKQII